MPPTSRNSNFEHIADSEWLSEWTQRYDIATAAWADDAVLDRIMVLPEATETGAGMLAQYTN